MSDFEFILVEQIGFTFQGTVFELVFGGSRGPSGAGLPSGGVSGDSIIKSSGIDFAFIILHNNLAASAAPVSGNDSSEGYAVKSLWFDTVAAKVYQCLDSTVGSAVWVDLSASGGGGGGGVEIVIETLDLTAWGSHQVDIDLTQPGYNDTYDFIKVVGKDLTRDGFGGIEAAFSEDGGATFLDVYGTRTNMRTGVETHFGYSAVTAAPLSGSNDWNGYLFMEFVVGNINSTHVKIMDNGHAGAKHPSRDLWDINGCNIRSTAIMNFIRLETVSNVVQDFTGGKIHIIGVNYG